MSTTLVVCPECGSPVAPGRLSCQSCGTLVASVVGSDRHPAVASAPAPLPDIDEDRPLAAFMPPEAAPELSRPTDPPAPKRGPRRLSRSKPAAELAPDRSAPVPPATPAAVPEQTSIFGAAPGAAPSATPPILQEWPDPSAGSATDGASSRNGAPLPGAYLAPSASYVAPLGNRPAAVPRPVTPPSPAPAPFSPAATTWAAQQASASPFASTGTFAGSQAPAKPSADTARSLSDWLVIGGSTLAIISFVLPWATDGVLGSNGVGYTAQWGLANGGHLVLIAATAIVLFLTVGSTAVPGWIRSSVLPLALGGLLAGVAFVYYARPFGGGSGVAVLLAGAVVLLVGGVLASRPGRNATGASTV